MRRLVDLIVNARTGKMITARREFFAGDRTLRAETEGEEVLGTGVSGFAY